MTLPPPTGATSVSAVFGDGRGAGRSGSLGRVGVWQATRRPNSAWRIRMGILNAPQTQAAYRPFVDIQRIRAE
jgi:hypothetical protein